jgi:hypothetical protein
MPKMSRERNVTLKTTRYVAAFVSVMARENGMTSSEAAHWMLLAMVWQLDTLGTDGRRQKMMELLQGNVYEDAWKAAVDKYLAEAEIAGVPW